MKRNARTRNKNTQSPQRSKPLNLKPCSLPLPLPPQQSIQLIIPGNKSWNEPSNTFSHLRIEFTAKVDHVLSSFLWLLRLINFLKKSNANLHPQTPQKKRNFPKHIRDSITFIHTYIYIRIYNLYILTAQSLLITQVHSSERNFPIYP